MKEGEGGPHERAFFFAIHSMMAQRMLVRMQSFEMKGVMKRLRDSAVASPVPTDSASSDGGVIMKPVLSTTYLQLIARIAYGGRARQELRLEASAIAYATLNLKSFLSIERIGRVNKWKEASTRVARRGLLEECVRRLPLPHPP